MSITVQSVRAINYLYNGEGSVKAELERIRSLCKEHAVSCQSMFSIKLENFGKLNTTTTDNVNCHSNQTLFVFDAPQDLMETEKDKKQFVDKIFDSITDKVEKRFYVTFEWMECAVDQNLVDNIFEASRKIAHVINGNNKINSIIQEHFVEETVKEVEE